MNINRQNKVLGILTDIAWGGHVVAGSRHAAAIVLKNEIISVGINRDKTHPIQDLYKKNQHAKLMHAEIDAIRQALRLVDEADLMRCDLYIVRVKYADRKRKVQLHGGSKPCCGCMRAINRFRFRNVYYTTDDGTGFEKLTYEHQLHILAEESIPTFL